MTLKEAILWAERDIKNLSGVVEVSNIIYYVIPWNGEYIVQSENHIKRHLDTKYVYDTKTKKINVDNLKENLATKRNK